MTVVFSLRYDEVGEEVKLTTTRHFNSMDTVLKLDCLKDALYELQNKYEEEIKQGRKEWQTLKNKR